MTIVVAAASPDGIVLAADSRTTFSDGGRHRISSDTADKVFALNQKFGVATYGMALIGDRTINGLMDEFLANTDRDECTDGKTTADKLGAFFHERYEAQFGATQPVKGWPLGFVLAGYDAAGIGRVWEIGIPGPSVTETPVTTASRGALWRGQVDVIGRLIKGYDINAIQAAGQTFDESVQTTLSSLEYIVLTPLTLQDAADMAAFLVRTTIDMQRFSDGTGLAPGLVPGCGGETQMLAVTRAGTEWIRRRWLTGVMTPGRAEGSNSTDPTPTTSKPSPAI